MSGNLLRTSVLTQKEEVNHDDKKQTHPQIKAIPITLENGG